MTRSFAALLTAAALTMMPSFAAAQQDGEPAVNDDAAADAAGDDAAADDAAGDDVARDGAAGDAGPEDATAAEEEEEYAEEEEGEEEYAEEEDYGEVEFCGGDESSIVDEAYGEMTDGRLSSAREMLVTALRHGAVEQWQRGHALATLAEVQLRLRQYGQAIVNYRKALRVDPDGLAADVRVGLATALYLRGAYPAAHQEAVAVRDSVCSARWSMEACFGAQSIIARTSRDAVEREQAVQTLSTIRTGHGDLADSFDEMERRLGRGRARNRPVGDRS